MSQSDALTAWTGERSDRLNRLGTAHSAIATGSAGRQWFTEELNHAIIVRLSAEFQGFARDLHDEAVDGLFTPATVPVKAVLAMVGPAMKQGRKLDYGNPNPGHLGSDFGRLGLKLWPALDAAYPKKSGGWNATLEALNHARNAIAHQDDLKLTQVKAATPLTKPTITKWRKHLDAVAYAMDVVVGDYVGQVTGQRPW